MEKSHEPCVRYDVCNCIHNDQECCCTAKDIKIGPHSAHCCSDTVCQSFQSQK